VCPEALSAALRSNALAGAGTDVAYREPMKPWDPDWRLPNMIITPHITPRLPDRTKRTIDIVEENLGRLRRGEELLNRLGPDDVYTRTPPAPPATRLDRLLARGARRGAGLWYRLAQPRIP
jgi:phosphoglycerate dehydrogenase-like enzyme